MLLPITLTLTAASALLSFWLAMRIGQARAASKVTIGDGGDPQLIARMRAQANFVEYTPFVIILTALIELARGPQAWLWGVAILYVIARIAHAFGMDRPAPNAPRMIGILATFIVLLALAAYGLFLVYTGEKF